MDYVTVQRTANPPEKLGPLAWDDIQEPGTPRDFEARDAFLDLDIKRLTIDGNIVPMGSVSAELPFMAFPDRGRFVLSLAPRPEVGFRLAGVIRGNRLGFSINGHTVEVVSSRRISPGAGPFNLYVLHHSGTTLMSMPAGDYIAYAFQDIEPNSWWDPEVMQKYAGLGTPVRIEPNGRQLVNLKLIPSR